MYDVAHIGVVVQDADKSLDFYCNVLGFKAAGTYQDGRVRLEFIKSGCQTIELIQYKEDTVSVRSSGRVDHIAFAVTDLDAEIDHLRQHDVTLLLESPLINGDNKIMFFAGPDGERLEFVQKI